MRQRCSNPKYHAYARYGGRGIQVCDRWRNSNRAGTELSAKGSVRHSQCSVQQSDRHCRSASSALLALHGVAHALARRPWVALERLAGAGRSPAYAFLATPLKRYPGRYPTAFASVAVAMRTWRNALTWLIDYEHWCGRSTRGKNACFWGTDQRITSGPAARTAAFRGRIHGCTRTFRQDVRFFSLAPRAPSIHGTKCGC